MKKKQSHTHEFEGSTKIAELVEDPHNHRFAGVSGPSISVKGGHIHKIKSRTDYYDHLHYIETTSGLQINVGDGKHVHFVKTTTSINDYHSHELIFATLIESPIFEEEK
ncbi:YmaF family protein [Clostridium lacusfryxellense]|uniref:YmaF family protein n=1 Tax=Clostridium lacusfryxellense TaxID=205328 RepID=UPI001C0CB8CB|nr:YmaF family protein [Clostridium lacusfryxellense]MBU3110257.1 YmaF family protein [Clostridium lacusfryxellense]